MYSAAKITCIGSGLIGTGYAISFLMNGCNVSLYDPDPAKLEHAIQTTKAVLHNFTEKGYLLKENVGTASYTSNLKEALEGAFYIQESGPENYDAKQAILAEVEKYAPQDAIFASSTSGLLISEIAKYAKHPDRCIGAHPYNPPYLIPLIEISKGSLTSEKTVTNTCHFLKSIGKEPIVLQKEVLGFVANRLSLALYREAVDLVVRGVCSVEDVDKAVCYGPGLRYAVMGPNLLYHLGGGSYGIKGILAHIGPSVEQWWEDMADWKKWPNNWGDIAQKGVEQEMANRTKKQGQTYEDAVRFRDEMILEILQLQSKV